MRIYITGCAHTGTTLLKRLFFSFRGVEVIPREISTSDFVRHKSDANFLVGKRTVDTVFASGLSKKREVKQINLHLRHGSKLIVTMRSGRDTIESGYTSPSRWIDCINSYVKYARLVPVTVFYRDLVTCPNTVQELLQAHFGLEAHYAFSDYPELVPPHNDGQSQKYELRPISTDGLDKDYDWEDLVPEEITESFCSTMKLFHDLYKVRGLNCH